MDQRERAIEEVYRVRYAGFRHAVAALLGDDGAAHDAVQDGFARALARREDFRGGSLEAWVWRIVLRAAFDLARERRPVPVEDRLDPSFIRSERDPRLAAAIRALPPRRRLMVFLRHFADLPYSAIATTCGVSEGTVAATLAQAHADLRDVLELEGVER
jgi:RNA polymerase sigma factor (sigma-70 family)